LKESHKLLYSSLPSACIYIKGEDGIKYTKVYISLLYILNSQNFSVRIGDVL